jgi:hypothetical protein
MLFCHFYTNLQLSRITLSRLVKISRGFVLFAKRDVDSGWTGDIFERLLPQDTNSLLTDITVRVSRLLCSGHISSLGDIEPRLFASQPVDAY